MNIVIMSTKFISLYSVVVLYDLDFNPQNDRQAEDRAHRKFPLIHLY
jgi:hypothetical protein